MVKPLKQLSDMIFKQAQPTTERKDEELDDPNMNVLLHVKRSKDGFEAKAKLHVKPNLLKRIWKKCLSTLALAVIVVSIVGEAQAGLLFCLLNIESSSDLQVCALEDAAD